MTGQESSPRTGALDDGWSEEEEDALDSAWGDDERNEEPLAPGAPARVRTLKRQRPKRAPREIRAERTRTVEHTKAEARAEKERLAAAKQKVKQPREKKPKPEGPSKKELRRAKQAEAASVQMAVYAGDPDLTRDENAARRRGGSLQDARLAKRASAGLPPYVAYAVLALLVGAAVVYLLVLR